MAITLTEADHAVLVAIFRQIETSKIDTEQLRVDLGLTTKNAAGMRITRLKAKLRGHGKTKTKPRATKKRKASKDSDDEESLDSFHIEHIEGRGWEHGKVKMPGKRMPARKTRVTSFKEEDNDDLEGEEEAFGERLDGDHQDFARESKVFSQLLDGDEQDVHARSDLFEQEA